MNLYKRHRFAPDIISYAVWLCRRFNLSLGEIEDLLTERYYSQLRVRPSLAPQDWA